MAKKGEKATELEQAKAIGPDQLVKQGQVILRMQDSCNWLVCSYSKDPMYNVHRGKNLKVRYP